MVTKTIKKLIHPFYRKPDFIIGSVDNPYLLRWWVIPRNRFFNIYLHKFLRSDDDRALHDHPWPSCSIILRGGYMEHMPNQVVRGRKKWRPYIRRATQAHRIELFRNYEFAAFRGNPSIRELVPISEIPAWTIFVTGPKVREWGFHCPKGWRHWRDFVSVYEGDVKGNEVGRGCE